MKLPDSFENYEQHREYLAFRVQIQMRYSLTHQKDTSKSTILTLMKNMIKRSKTFPSQPFSNDIRVYVYDFDQNDSKLCDPDDLLAGIYNFLQIKPDNIQPIKTTQDFSEALERLLE